VPVEKEITSMPELHDTSGWFDQPMRWLQINLVPDDIGGTDVAGWKQYWTDARVEGLTISAAGASAFYPTDVPMHCRVTGVDARDLFGELVAAAKGLDIRVLARFEPHFTSHEVGEARPEWMIRPVAPAVGAPTNGTIGFLASINAGRPRPCMNGPYFREFMPAVMTEIATRYPVDGFYANGWPFIGGGPPTRVGCACESCVARWEARGMGALPVEAGVDDPEWPAYLAFVQESYEEVQHLWQRHVKALRPSLSFVCNLHGSLSSGVRWREFSKDVDLYVNDTQGRHLIGADAPGVMSNALWRQAQSAAVVEAVAGGRPTFHLVGAWHVGNPLLRRVAKEPVELTMMLAQVVARGARPWCNVAGGVVYDRRWKAAVLDYYTWHASAERFLRNTASGADVGILWTPEALWPEWQAPSGRGPSLAAAAQGWHEVLLRVRRPYSLVPDFRCEDHILDRYAVVVVPSGSTVDQATAERLRAYVERGGGLVLGCGTLHPARGPVGGEAVLAELVGVSAPAPPAGPFFAAYVDLLEDGPHDLLADVGDTQYLPGGAWTALPQASVAADGVGRFQPPLPFLADLAVVTEEPTDAPVLTSRGKVVYLGTDLDSLHGVAPTVDAATLLRNALRVATAASRPACQVSGPGLIDVNVWHQERSATVHLVNLTNPQLYGGPFEDLVEVGPHTVELALDPQRDVEQVRLLRAGASAAFERSGDGTLTVQVPSIRDFEIVAVEGTR
jgi:hypothetical protein